MLGHDLYSMRVEMDAKTPEEMEKFKTWVADNGGTIEWGQHIRRRTQVTTAFNQSTESATAFNQSTDNATASNQSTDNATTVNQFTDNATTVNQSTEEDEAEQQLLDEEEEEADIREFEFDWDVGIEIVL